jgi:hypothetical protein
MWPTGSVPAQIARLRTHLQACQAWLDAGGAEAQVHYPSINASGAIGNGDTLPAALLMRGDTGRMKYAEGARGLPSGDLEVVFYLDGAEFPTASTVETFADAVLDQLLAQDTGLPWQRGNAGLASDPTQGARAAKTGAKPHDYRTISLFLQYGLNA